MSTSGRINKSTTKFVPKRKSGPPSSQRASSATPSLSGTPRLAANSLPSLAEVTPWGTEQGSPSLTETFLAPRPPHSKTQGSPRVGVAPGGSFGPSDPSLKSSQSQHVPQSSQRSALGLTSSPQLGSSLGLGFGPSDPSASQYSTQPSSFGRSQAPPSSPSLGPTPALAPATASSSPSRGTAFSVSLTGPPVTKFAPPAIELAPAPVAPSTSAPLNASASTAPVPSVKPSGKKATAPKKGGKKSDVAALDSLTDAVAALIEEEARAEEEEEQVPTQREIEQEALAEEAAAKAKAKAKGKRAAKKVVAEGEDDAPSAKRGKATEAKGKGKQTALDVDADVEGEADFAPPEDAQAANAKIKLRKPRATKKVAAPAPEDDPSDEGDEGSVVEPESEPDESAAEGEASGSTSKKRKRKTTKTKDSKPLFEPASDGEAEQGQGEEGEGVDGEPRARTPRKLKETQSALEALPSHLVISDYASDGSESGSDGERRPIKKRFLRRKTRTELAMITVEPVITRMSDLATAKDNIRGRESTRGAELAKLVAKQKADRRIKRAKMRERALKKHRGEPVTDDEADMNGHAPSTSAAATRAGSPAALSAPPPGEGEGDPTGNNTDDEMERDARQAETQKLSADDDDDNDDDDDIGGLVETQYVPQMRLVNGVMVVDDASLEIDRALDARMGYTGPREVVEETANDRFVNAASWGKGKRTDKWSLEETDLFYEYLHQFGTDFEMIAALFPLRNRRQIKAKWTKEDRLHPQRITAALMQKKEINLDEYARLTNTNLSGPIPEDPMEKINKIRAQLEADERANPTVFGQPGPGPSTKKGKKAAAMQAHALEEEEKERLAKEKAIREQEEHDEDEVERIRAEEAAQRAIDEEIEEAERAEKKKKQRKGKGKA